MWSSLLRGGAGELLELASPKLFSVLPARDLVRSLRALRRNASDGVGRRAALAERQCSLEAHPFGVVLGRVDETHVSGLRLSSHERGHRVLRLYFHQLYAPGPTLLDLRAKTFSHGSDVLFWTGGAVYVAWDDTFISMLRSLYAGYYRDDAEEFRAALDALGLDVAEKEIRSHFGGADPSAVSFALPRFRTTFLDIFRRCREADSKIHPDFVPLGVYLTCLYQHLEFLGGTYDVRCAFEQEAGASPGDQRVRWSGASR